MSEDVERSLADMQVDEDLIVDTTVDPVPEDFDMDAWLAGVRPTRRSVKLYPQAHLIGRMEEIAVEIDNTPASQPVDDLIDEYDRLKAEFHAGVWFTIEKRSSEWEQKFRKDLSKRHQLDWEKKEDDMAIILCYQLAEQIVSPQISFNQLRKLRTVNEGEWNKLAMTMTAANSSLAEKAGVLDRDFSERRSDSDQD